MTGDTSLADLVEANSRQQKPPTLYAEFVNKEGLFRAVLDRYISRFAAKHEAVLFAEGKSVDRALRDYFTGGRHLLYQQRDAGRLLYHQYLPRVGRLLDGYRQYHQSRHAMQEQALTQFLQQRQAQGELPAGRDVAQLAQFLNCVLQGMSISAREGADFDKLMQSPIPLSVSAAGPRVLMRPASGGILLPDPLSCWLYPHKID